MTRRRRRKSERAHGLHDPPIRRAWTTRPAVEPSMMHSQSGEYDGEPEMLPPALPDPEIGDPLVLDPEVQRLLDREDGRDIPLLRRVFVNRTLRMDGIKAVGFDMDYTLAVYHLRRVEELSYRMTIEVMVRDKRYPEWIAGLEWEKDFVIRGLVVDKKLGNILKMDRHGHVGRVYHGMRALSKEERIRHYRRQKIRFSTARYVWLDTLFALPEAVLYAQIIEHALRRGDHIEYARLYDDIRDSIDQVHRDGSLKAVMRKDLGHYIGRDPDLGNTLHRLRSSGKRLFLLTNSYWQYTDEVMKYLLEGQASEYPTWRSYFDLILVGARKPAFFSEREPFHEVDAQSGEVSEKAAETLERDAVYQNGNFATLERLTGWKGDGVLYVGDHIYGDILRTKQSGMWRTAMIIQELEDELAYTHAREDDWERLRRLEGLRSEIDDEINVQKSLFSELEKQVESPDAAKNGVVESYRSAKEDLERLRRALRAVIARAKLLGTDLHRGANPYWGLLFKEYGENSRFGEQVEDYACVYTSRVTNLGAYSPMQYYRSPRETMPHEE